MPLMNLFEPLFLIFVALTAVSLLAAAAMAVAGRRLVRAPTGRAHGVRALPGLRAQPY
jgi:hypothetical protein